MWKSPIQIHTMIDDQRCVGKRQWQEKPNNSINNSNNLSVSKFNQVNSIRRIIRGTSDRYLFGLGFNSWLYGKTFVGSRLFLKSISVTSRN
jgi:hypothetical protein